MSLSQSRETAPFRDLPVDLLRGLAITIMVGANLIPFLLAQPAPFWLRVTASFAAPLFIFLSGMMVALSSCRKKHSLSYFLIRGGSVVLLGALLDLLARGTVPFLDFDVLYLIGISLPLAFLFLTLCPRKRILVIISIIAITPFFQAFFGYSGLPLQVPIIPAPAGSALPAASSVVLQWLVGGWFPIFPWLAVALLGAHTGTFRWGGGTIRSFADSRLVLPAGGALAIGAVLLSLMPGRALTPYGYVELFYPPTPVFLLFIVGGIFLLFVLTDAFVISGHTFRTLQVMGQCSLAIYVIHTLVIELCIRPLQLQVSLPAFLAGYFLFLVMMAAVAYGIRSLRLSLAHPPFIIRLLIGG